MEQEVEKTRICFVRRSVAILTNSTCKIVILILKICFKLIQYLIFGISIPNELDSTVARIDRVCVWLSGNWYSANHTHSNSLPSLQKWAFPGEDPCLCVWQSRKMEFRSWDASQLNEGSSERQREGRIFLTVYWGCCGR